MHSLIIIQLKHWLIEKMACSPEAFFIISFGIAGFFCLPIACFTVHCISSIIDGRIAEKTNNNIKSIMISVLFVLGFFACCYTCKIPVKLLESFRVEMDFVQKKYAVQQREIEKEKIAEDEKLTQLRIQKWQEEKALIEQSKKK